MMYKKPGVYLIHKRRVIHLFEADYNFNISTIFGRKAMYLGVDNHTLHTSQWLGATRQTMFGRGGNERAHPSGRKNDKDSSRQI
jgi:hypothetical protein